jgi:hypothetical protein
VGTRWRIQRRDWLGNYWQQQSLEGYFRVHFGLQCGSLKGNHGNLGEDKYKPAADVSVQFLPSRNRYRMFVVVCV